MQTSVSMLRGVNVGGKRKIPMERLRECYESLGFRSVRTYIQSGNVVFEHDGADPRGLSPIIASKIKEEFGFDAVVINRTREEISLIIKGMPFRGVDEDRVHVTFLSVAPSRIPVAELEAARGKTERFRSLGREVYLYCPEGYGRAKLSNSFLEKKLGVSATTRNWRTVMALGALATR